MANRARGEVDVEICGKTYTLRPTFTVIAGIETALNEGVLPLAQKISDGSIKMLSLATILLIALKDQEGTPNLEAIGQDMMARGHKTFLEPVGLFLLAAVSGLNKPASGGAGGAGEP